MKPSLGNLGKQDWTYMLDFRCLARKRHNILAPKPVFHLLCDLGDRMLYLPSPPFSERCVVPDSLDLCHRGRDGRFHIDALAKHSSSVNHVVG